MFDVSGWDLGATQYTLTISSTAGGSVATPGEGTYPYACGTAVNLVATPATGYRFVNWTGDVSAIDDVNSASTIISMNRSHSVTANFEQIAGPHPECVDTAPGTGIACFTAGNGTIEDLEAVPAPSPLPPGVKLPHGMFTFRITGLTPGQSVTLTVEFPDPIPPPFVWWKYHNDTWSRIPISKTKDPRVITFTLTDGVYPDDEDDIPGQITDQGGPGSPGSVG
jgi:hypothetical protein